MLALCLHRDQYGPPAEALGVETVPTPNLTSADAQRVLVSILATGPNFNTNFAALGLPVPPFGRGDSATLHIPGSDALGIVVDAGPAVTSVRVGDAVILDSWTGSGIRGYETHDGFNAQFAVVDEERAIALPSELKGHSPEQLAAMLLTYGTAYRAVVERLAVRPGDSVLVMGGGKGTSFAGAQIAKTLGARVVLVGSNSDLAGELIERGMADSFINRREIPEEVFGVLPENVDPNDWQERTEPFREAVRSANDGQLVDKVFEHTGGVNFPLLVSALAPGGALAFFGATGRGLKGEYKETFFGAGQRHVMDARWVWMRQKQVLFRSNTAREIFSEIGLLPGRKVLIWGADDAALSFVRAAQERGARLAVIASHTQEADGLARLAELGVTTSQVIDRDELQLVADMPDPLTDDGAPNPDYHERFMLPARKIGKAIWGLFGPRESPDVIVERTDQSTLHYSTFLLRDFDERDAMSTGYVVLQGDANLDVLGSHMYHASQARETVRLLSEGAIVMDQEDLDVVPLDELPAVQQKMLDGTMTKPKGVALVQASAAGRSIQSWEAAFLGNSLRAAAPSDGQFLDLRLLDGILLISITRPSALNALSEELLAQLGGVVDELATSATCEGQAVRGVVVRGSGRAFVAGADVQVFVGKSASDLERLANANMAVFSALENLELPVVSLIDGFALGGGNELAMSTHYRIATENATLGQPEVKLGVIPGYGGMQRLPRLVGPRLAAEMSINGEPVDGATAVAIGLADEFQPSSTALRSAFEAAVAMAEGKLDVPRKDWDEVAQGQRSELERLAKDETAKRLLGFVAKGPQALEISASRSIAAAGALSALLTGYQRGFASGLANDARIFGEVTSSESGQHWVGRFLAKDPEQSSFLTLLPPSG